MGHGPQMSGESQDRPTSESRKRTNIGQFHSIRLLPIRLSRSRIHPRPCLRRADRRQAREIQTGHLQARDTGEGGGRREERALSLGTDEKKKKMTWPSDQPKKRKHRTRGQKSYDSREKVETAKVRSKEAKFDKRQMQKGKGEKLNDPPP